MNNKYYNLRTPKKYINYTDNHYLDYDFSCFSKWDPWNTEHYQLLTYLSNNQYTTSKLMMFQENCWKRKNKLNYNQKCAIQDKFNKFIDDESKKNNFSWNIGDDNDLDDIKTKDDLEEDEIIQQIAKPNEEEEKMLNKINELEQDEEYQPIDYQEELQIIMQDLNDEKEFYSIINNQQTKFDKSDYNSDNILLSDTDDDENINNINKNKIDIINVCFVYIYIFIYNFCKINGFLFRHKMIIMNYYQNNRNYLIEE